MIECKHKHQLAATNRGLLVEMCRLTGNMVNDTICRKCASQDGSGDIRPPMENEFLTRTEEEIKATHMVCSGCPFFNADRQTCKSRVGEPLPVDIVAQNPSEHCPEHQW